MIDCAPASLAQSSSCFLCLPDGMSAPIRTWLLCQWANKPIGPTVCSEPLVDSWVNDITIVGGYQSPSAATIEAVCQFVQTLRVNGILNKFVAINPIIPPENPDSLNALGYALWPNGWGGGPGFGFQPWVNNNFVLGDLSLDGLTGDALSKYYDTGLGPDVTFGLDDGGLTVYETVLSPFEGLFIPEYELGVYSLVDGTFFLLSALDEGFVGSGPVAWWYDSVGVATVPSIGQLGFYSGSRESVILLNLWRGVGGVLGPPIATSVADQTTANGPADPILFMAAFDRDSFVPTLFSGKTIALAAIHHGLTQAETEIFYTASRQLRVDFGGLAP